jgi:hypothetical protein
LHQVCFQEKCIRLLHSFNPFPLIMKYHQMSSVRRFYLTSTFHVAGGPFSQSLFLFKISVHFLSQSLCLIITYSVKANNELVRISQACVRFDISELGLP